LAEELKSLQNYINAIEKKLALGDATEHTHRSALETLAESLETGITATNEPKHIDCGAPDFILRKDSATIGYIEAKDIGKNLDDEEKSEQLKRYRDSLSNLILTDYLEFRWYVDGERQLSARLGTASKEGRIKRDKEGIQTVIEILNNFLVHRAEGVGTPRELAQRMARQAHLIRNLIIKAFEKEPEKGSLHSQLAAFRENLIPDLSVEYFADMYAQTLAYGLFAARCSAPENKDFTRRNAAYLLSKTNPFLRKLFNQIAGPDLDERISWLVDDLSQLLAQADMESILKDFGHRSGKEDPVVHFYETFLKAYDPKIRDMRGVYYTPEPVVSYIVRSIDHLLKDRFNKPQGLADEKTLILDPAVGTATFLYKVISEIYQATTGKGQKGLWNNYVAEKLLSRIFGFELLMAPYAIAHLKLELLLKETGYDFKGEQRLGIYLTNTLEEEAKHSETLFAQWISEEANAAARVKKDAPIMVVLGNPPYAVSSTNKSEYIERLMERYKAAVRSERNIQPLSDDYIKFIRFAHERIERTGHGIIGMITNNSYLTGLIHRGMREELLKSFSEIYVLNLHGSSILDYMAPDGSRDENVFDIRQGVAIILLVKWLNYKGATQIYHSDLLGPRESKYRTLTESDIITTSWTLIEPNSPFYFFVPGGSEFRQEYDAYSGLTDIFQIYSSGIKTHRDHFVIDYSASILKERIASFRDTTRTDEWVTESFKLEGTNSWYIADARKTIRDDKDWEKAFTRCLYRPFDIRPIFYHKAVIERPRPEVMHHMLAGKNLALISMRQVALHEPYSHFGVTQLIADNRAFYSNRGIQCLFPLYLYPTEGEMQFGSEHRQANLKSKFIKVISEKLGLKFNGDGNGDLKKTFGPEDIFNYAYAIFHSPTYRTRYAEYLKIDFPRLPITSDKELFKELVGKGTELVALHLMESSLLNKLSTRYPIDGSDTVEKVSYDESSQRVYINKTQYFEGVPLEVWNFHIGGYQVCQKWIKDRKDRTLTYDEQNHYQKIMVALKETSRLMEEIDTLITKWPIA